MKRTHRETDAPLPLRVSAHVGALLFVALLSFVCPAAAGTETAGVRVAPGHAGEETQPVIFPDGEGGFFVGFIGENGTLHTARLRSDATPSSNWTETLVDSLQVDNPSGTRVALLRPGVVVGFSDLYAAADPVYFWLRPFTPLGKTLPDSSKRSQSAHVRPVLVGKPDGGMLAISPEANESLVAQFSTAVLGTDLSLVEDVRVTLGGSFTMMPVSSRILRAIPDGSGGAWGVVQVGDNGSPVYRNLLASRINPDGTVALTGATSRTVAAAARNQDDQQLASDGAGGVLVAFHDTRSTVTVDDIYAVRLLADGSLATGWTVNGKAIAVQLGSQLQPAIAEDGAGGCWIAWTDGRSGENDIYFMRVLASGSLAPGFVAGGRPLCAAAGGQVEPKLAADGAGGVFAVWLDARDGELDLYAQHIAADGSVVAGWVDGGAPLCTDPTAQSAARVIATSTNRALAVWADTRSGSKRLYTALLTKDQVLGVPPRATPGFALRAASVPARGAIELRLASGEGAVQVSLHDVSGRIVATRRVENPSGDEVVRFAAGTLRPGVYLARASRAGVSTECRVILIR